MERRPSLRALSGAEDAHLEPLLPERPPRGRPWRWPLCEILDGSCSIVRTGAQWRALPHAYPPWPTVSWWFRRWRLTGPGRLGHSRRLSKDDERLCATGEARICTTMTRLMARRLARA